jgi:hypothetical protein
VCLDLSALLGERSKDHKECECGVISQLMETSQMNKLLLHPVITTFIMVKYNTYAWLIWTLILVKLAFCMSLSRLVLEANDTDTKENWLSHRPTSFWAELSFLVLITILLLTFTIVGLVIDQWSR